MRIFDDYKDCLTDDERELANLDPAWAKAALYFRTGMHYGHPAGSMRTQALENIHRHLQVFRRRHRGGDNLALLHAVSMCAEENLPMPTWLALSFCSCFAVLVQPGRAASLDEIFRSPRLPTDTPKKLARAKQDWSLGATLWRDLWLLVQANKSIASLDEGVTHLLAGGNYGVRKTKAKELIATVETNQLEFLDPTDSLSQFLQKRRKRMT
jgi:hypothetical protein